MSSDRNGGRKFKKQPTVIHGPAAVAAVNNPRLFGAENLDRKKLAFLADSLM